MSWVDNSTSKMRRVGPTTNTDLTSPTTQTGRVGPTTQTGRTCLTTYTGGGQTQRPTRIGLAW